MMMPSRSWAPLPVSAFDGHNFVSPLAGANGNSHTETMARGTSLSAQVFAETYTYQIDNEGPVVVTAPTGWSFISLFSGRPDTTYRVKLWGQYIESDVTLRLAGSDPLFSRPADIPNYSASGGTSPYADFVAKDGVNSSTDFFSAAQPMSSFSQPNATGLRFRAATTSVRLWAYTDIGRCLLFRDGVQVADVTPVNSTGKFQLLTIATGLDDTAADYALQCIGVGATPLISALLVDTLEEVTQTAKQAIVFNGDSTTQGNVLADQTDSRVMNPYIVANALDCAAIRIGGSGAKIAQGLANVPNVIGVAAEVAMVVNQWGLNDVAQATDLDTFQSTYEAMLTGQRAGLAGVPILAQGMWDVDPSWTNATLLPDYNARIAAAVAAVADPAIYFMPMAGVLTSPTIAANMEDGSGHPNALGYAKIGAAELAFIAANL